jgi:hypothetical protein
MPLLGTPQEVAQERRQDVPSWNSPPVPLYKEEEEEKDINTFCLSHAILPTRAADIPDQKYLRVS